jgi:phenylacetate-coenzyme A ligase PaaK-like adenylate-forming protein
MAGFREAQAGRALTALSAFFEPSDGSSPGPGLSAEGKVLDLFQRAARDVPAYASFLREQGVNPTAIGDLESFRTLPVTTKENYYRRYPLPELCWHGQLDACDMVALSTGSTGEPAAWPRFITHELESSARFEQILAGAFEARERRTLLVICFALGNWVGGIYTLECCRHLAAKGYPLTLVSPGNQPAEIFRALRALTPYYDQRVLFGYPPFLKDVVDLGVSEGFDWSEKPTRLVMAGEVFSEEWRDWLCRGLHMPDPAVATSSLYGTADAGVLANETPLSIRIRRALARRPELVRELFGEARLPTLCQYDPTHRFFEVEDGWLLFSGDGGAPLLRYKILDRGGVLSHAEMHEFLARHSVDVAVDLEGESEPGSMGAALPFVYVFGRSHFAVSFYGANVYPENVSVGLQQPELARWLTGKFVLEVNHDAQQNARLHLKVELLREISPSAGGERLAAQVEAHVRQHLERLNGEFLSYVPDAQRTPEVELRPFGDAEWFPPGVKHRYTR